MNIEGFGSCCGICIVEGFYPDHNTSRFLTELDSHIADSWSWFGYDKLPGLVLAALIDDQVKAYGKLLKKHGFSVFQKRFFNPNSGNHITLYGKLINQPEKKRVKSPSRTRVTRVLPVRSRSRGKNT